MNALLKAGFYVHHQKGSHVHLRHESNQKLRVTVPRHDQFELPPFVINSILKQGDISREDFLRLLKK